MPPTTAVARALLTEPAPWRKRPAARLQPILAKAGKPTVDLDRLARDTAGLATLAPLIAVESPEHWDRAVRDLGPEVDAILPLSIPAYPTEVWNSHPQPLVARKLPLLFWPLQAYDEPDFWRWSARDFLQALGVEVHLIASARHGLATLRALGLRRLLRDSRLVVFGEQNFPWNAHAAGHLVTASLGTRIVVRSLADFRTRAGKVADAQAEAFWQERRHRYREQGVRPEALREAVRTYLGIRSVLEEEQALGFGVNCFGDLITGGGRDTPCLAQTLAREDGYIASCDGDFLAMMSMVLATCFLDRTCVMSNLYPVEYVGALRDHFGDPLSPGPAVPREAWKNLARLAHCGFVGVVSPEMAPGGTVALRDWGGTYEIHRDGRGCGIDGDLPAGAVTALELKFDARTLLVAAAKVLETTRHPGMPHCESTALLEFRDLPGFVRDISREHAAFVYGDFVEEFAVLAGVLGLKARTY